MHRSYLTKQLNKLIFDFGIIYVISLKYYNKEQIYGSKIFAQGKRCYYLQP